MLDKHSLAELADIYKEKYNRLLKDNVELERQIDENNSEIEQLRKERDEARRQTNSILNEIDCRIEHGAESNGHLEAIRSLFKET